MANLGEEVTMHKLTFKTKEDAPEPLREFLKDNEAKDGFEVVLVPGAKLDEFRNNNIAVSKERDALKPLATTLEAILGKDKDGKLRSVDDFNSEITTLRQTAQQVADGKLKATGDIEKELGVRTESMKATYETKLTESGKEIARLKAEKEAVDVKLRQTTVDNAISMAAGDEKIGVNPHALSDVMRRARDVFVVKEDGSLEATENGVVLRGEDGVAAMTVPEWIKSLRKTAPHYFKSSGGGGAGGGDGNGSPTDAAAFAKMTPMQKLAHANRTGTRK
jgi:hypothetical protein